MASTFALWMIAIVAPAAFIVVRLRRANALVIEIIHPRMQESMLQENLLVFTERKFTIEEQITYLRLVKQEGHLPVCLESIDIANLPEVRRALADACHR
jgi:hypothetical protein